MLLLTIREHHHEDEAQSFCRGYVTRLPLGVAIEVTTAFAAATSARYGIELAFFLTHVSTIDDLSNAHIELANLVLVEDLYQQIARLTGH
jgi:hypothetical protein